MLGSLWPVALQDMTGPCIDQCLPLASVVKSKQSENDVGGVQVCALELDLDVVLPLANRANEDVTCCLPIAISAKPTHTKRTAHLRAGDIKASKLGMSVRR